jgi:ankyrin repeat protein
MAAREDAEELQERVLILAGTGKSAELKVLLEEHPEVDVDEYKSEDGGRALFHACWNGHTECARLLIDHREM